MQGFEDADVDVVGGGGGEDDGRGGLGGLAGDLWGSKVSTELTGRGAGG